MKLPFKLKKLDLKTLELSTGRAIQLAALIELAGLVVIGMTLVHFKPVGFLLFALVGLPLVGIGILVYVLQVVRNLLEKGAL